jgi:hypothetical protein
MVGGGPKSHLFELVNKFSDQINFGVLVFLVLTIVFVKKIPLRIRKYSGHFLGRILLFVLTLLVGKYYSWRNGLLVAILALLLLSLSPRTLEEGFHANVRVDGKQKWLVEQILKENPRGVDDKEVITQAIQDGSNSSSTSNK